MARTLKTIVSTGVSWRQRQETLQLLTSSVPVNTASDIFMRASYLTQGDREVSSVLKHGEIIVGVENLHHDPVCALRR